MAEKRRFMGMTTVIIILAIFILGLFLHVTILNSRLNRLNEIVGNVIQQQERIVNNQNDTLDVISHLTNLVDETVDIIPVKGTIDVDGEKYKVEFYYLGD